MDLVIISLKFCILLIIVPILLSAFIFIVVGTPMIIFLLLFEALVLFLINPIFKAINKIPFLGRVITSTLSLAIGISIMAFAFFNFGLPIIALFGQGMGV